MLFGTRSSGQVSQTSLLCQSKAMCGMSRVIFIFCCLTSGALYGQVGSPPPEFKNATLQERYQWMKSTSQTYQDYKVIKEANLDKEWHVALDSVKGANSRIRAAKGETARIQTELTSTQHALKLKQDQLAPTEYAATHINFIGIDFNKTAFSTTLMAIIGGLILVILLIIGRLKMVMGDVREKAEAFDRVTHELEDYKHKALEKQTKLSRELQNERNRQQDMRGSRV